MTNLQLSDHNLVSVTLIITNFVHVPFFDSLCIGTWLAVTRCLQAARPTGFCLLQVSVMLFLQ